MDQDLKDKINKSGNNLHLEVAGDLEMRGWEIELSQYYCDDITKIPREIDIIAKKSFAIFSDWDNDLWRCPPEQKFDVFLFIECKRFQESFAFRVIKNSQDLSRSALVSQNKNIFPREEDFKKFKAIEYHHYFVDRIGRLWDAANDKQERNIFDAITQPIKSLIFKEKEINHKAVFYPLVVYDGIDGFYAIEEVKPDVFNNYLDALPLISQLTFGLKYAYMETLFQGTPRRTSRDFFIDFVLRSDLKDWLHSLEKMDVNKIKEYLLRVVQETEFNYNIS